MANYIGSGLGSEFFPDVEPEGISLTVRSYGDLSIHEKDEVMREIERRILDMSSIKSLYSKTGGNDLVGKLRINLVNWQFRPSANELVEELHRRVDNYAGVEVEVRKDEMGPQQGKDLKLELSSRDPVQLEDAVRKVRAALDVNEHFTNIEDGGSKPGIEWQLKVDRALAATFGADATLVGTSVQMVTNGLKLGEYRPDDVDDDLDIRVRFPTNKRSINRLDELRLKTQDGLVPMTNFVEKSAIPKIDNIQRIDGRRVISLQADLAPKSQLGKALPLLQKQLEESDINWMSVAVSFKGQSEDQQESQNFLLNAFAIALFVMAIILVTQFNSFYQAMLILSAVLFSTVGVFLALLIAGKPFGIVMSGLGVISLAGIVVNNNIVLIDTYNVLRASGFSAKDAILRTGAQRLRPVLLTTVTTILGLLPMVLQMNIDFIKQDVSFGAPSTQWWAQLATAVAGGLAFATLLTLVLTPCLLAIRDYKQQKVKPPAWQAASAYEEI